MLKSEGKGTEDYLRQKRKNREKLPEIGQGIADSRNRKELSTMQHGMASCGGGD